MAPFHGDSLPPFGDGPGEGPEMEPGEDGVLVRTASKVEIDLKPIEHHMTPEGSACLGSYVNGNLIARCVLPEETAARFLRLGVLEEPVHLALLMEEADDSLDGKLLALTPVPDEMDPRQEGEDEAPWKQSVPSSNYEQAVADQGGDDDDRMAAVFLGKIVRLDKDRKHPENLAMEAADVLRSVVKRGASDVVERLLEDVESEFGDGELGSGDGPGPSLPDEDGPPGEGDGPPGAGPQGPPGPAAT